VNLAHDADIPAGQTDANGQPVPGSDIWVDWAVAVPVYNTFTESAFIIGADGKHLLSGISTKLDDQVNIDGGVLFGNAGAAEFGFLVQVPVFSADFRQEFEDFSLRFVYSYNLSSLTLKKEEKKDEKKDDKKPESSPASAPASAPAPH
jgi:hypothetical protein